MNKLTVLLVMLAVWATCPLVMAETVYIDDGASHTFDDSSYQDDDIFIDIYAVNNPGTNVNLVEGGLVRDLSLWNNSTLIMSGGSVRSFLWASDNSTVMLSGGFTDIFRAENEAVVTMIGGTVRAFDIDDNSTVIMTGGLVEQDILAWGNSTATLSGGAVGSMSVGGSSIVTTSEITVGGGFHASGSSIVSITDSSIGGGLRVDSHADIKLSGVSIGEYLIAESDATVTLSGGSVGLFLGAIENGTIFLEGTDFEVNGIALGDGDKLSDFVPLTEYRPQGKIRDAYIGVITGTLADGSYLDNEFMIHNIGEYEGTADIVIIPEPCSLVFLGFGVLVLRKLRG